MMIHLPRRRTALIRLPTTIPDHSVRQGDRSGFALVVTDVIRRPTMSGRKSRTTVSTSGSSGIPNPRSGRLISSPSPPALRGEGWGEGEPSRVGLRNPLTPTLSPQSRRRGSRENWRHFGYSSRSRMCRQLDTIAQFPKKNVVLSLREGYFTRSVKTTLENFMSSLTSVPDARGRFGPYGGQFVPETLMFALEQLASAYDQARADRSFQQEFERRLNEYVGRPSRLYFAERLTREAGGARIFLKREDMNHTGAHKINNCIGQSLLTMRMGKKRVIAETGAGQHGVATATAAALFGLECRVYMGEEDVRRQKLNVFKMKAMGTRVVGVNTGSRTLRDAINEAFRDWMASVATTHYVIGSVVGPDPFPAMVRDFQSVIGRETRAQCLEETGRLPDVVVACVGGGGNAAGMFHPFIGDRSVELVGVEAGGRGPGAGEHAATLGHGQPG